MFEFFTPIALFAESSISGRITDWSIKIMEALGGPGAALLIALENLFPPLPSEIILPLAGFTASQGSISFIGVIIWTTIGSLVGALALYYIGAWLGRDRVRHLAARLPLVKLKDIDKAEHWFMKHENQAVFIGRMIPVVRSLISLPAGIEKMSLKLFIAYSAIGSLIWNTALISAGYLLGEQWHIVEAYVGVLQYIVLGAFFIFVAHFVITRIQKRRRKKQAVAK